MKLWEPFANTFKADQLTLFHTDNWTVLVRKKQVTLGTLVLAANRNFISASELTRDELLELPDVVERLESALSDAFGFDKINYLLNDSELCNTLANNAYEFILKNFSWEALLPKYNKLYES